MLLTLLSAVPAAAGPWVKIKANTTDGIINALLTASSTGTPTTIVVAPGRYRFTQSFDTGVGPSLLPPVKTTVFVIGTDVGTTILDGSPTATDGRIFTVTKGGWLVVRNLTITHAGFTANDVSRGGGAAANFGGYLEFDDCLLVANGTGAENGAFGGAILSVSGRLGLERVTVMNNTAYDDGGGIAILGGTAVIHDSIISGNEAATEHHDSVGGGVLIFGPGATVTIGRSTVSGNRAWGSGGGIYNSGTLWLSNSAVMENVSNNGEEEIFGASVGGGITNAGLMRIKNGTVGGNETGTFGGGIMNGGRLFLRGTTIARNDVVGLVVGAPEPGDCPITFEGACSGGGGVWNAEGGTVSSVRTVLANNTLLRPDDPFAMVGPDCGGRVQSEGYNALGDASGCDLRRSYVLHGQPTQDQVGVDPRLGELQDSGVAGNAHYPLLPDSPLIDAGSNNWNLCTAQDQIGQDRVDGNGDGIFACDIGAIEFHRPYP
jgi:hypothetical protein